jgi:hypothetical protein
MTEQVQQAQQEQPQVTIADLAMAVRVIDLAVERGGFRGPETSTVGTVRDRLARFVEAQQAAQQAQMDPNAPKDAPVPPSAAGA